MRIDEKGIGKDKKGNQSKTKKWKEKEGRVMRVHRKER